MRLRALVARHRLGIVVFLVAIVGVLWFHEEHPVRETAGDEPAYFRVAVTSDPHDPSLPAFLPGNMRLQWWPPLTFALYGELVREADLDPDTPRLPHDRHGRELLTPESFVRRVGQLNVVLMLGTGLLVYVLALHLGISPPAAAVALGVTTLNPRMWFYVQALWPEWLHAIVFVGAIVLLVRFTRDDRSTWLALASALFGVAALIKAIAGGFLALLVPALVFLYRRRGRSRAPAIVMAGVLPFVVVTGPQALRNHHEHGTLALSANTWINVEAGLLPPPQTSDGGPSTVFERYSDSASDALTREALSRDRVIEHLTHTSPFATLGRVARNYYFSVRHSFFRGGVVSERWSGAHQLDWMVPLVTAGSALLFVLGAVGLVLALRRHPSHIVVALFLFYYLLALGVVGFNPRFFVQAIPFLGVMSALALDRAGWSSTVRDAVLRIVRRRTPS